MIVVVLAWILIFLVFYIFGYTVITLIKKISGKDDSPVDFAEYYFTGFLTVSTFSSIISIFAPVATPLLILVCIAALVLFTINRKGIISVLKWDLNILKSLPGTDKAALFLLILFILTIIVHPITLGDTESYHAQTIQWIRKYSVVPGLGNIHGRLAFNSMFFIISGLFTFQIKEVLIFPIIGITFMIVAVKLYLLYEGEMRSGNVLKGIMFILMLLISLPLLIYDLNSTSPDVICSLLVIYTFVLILEKKSVSWHRFVLLNMVVISCITFKLSSIFLIFGLLFFIRQDFFRRILLTIGASTLILVPFLIRNYYLSGYLIYPYPAIDLFSVDWKIPYDQVMDMKSEIAGFAKIPFLTYQEVLAMNINEWLVPWFNTLTSNQQYLLIINLFSVFTFIIMLVKKEFFLASLQTLIFINLIFWLSMAPDPRFAYGFIFAGASLTIAYLIKLINEYLKISFILRYNKIILALIMIIFVYNRADYIKNVLLQQSKWIIPAPFGAVETIKYYAGFEYTVPVPGGGCYNEEIPCVPFPLENVVARGANLQDGFKAVKVE